MRNRAATFACLLALFAVTTADSQEPDATLVAQQPSDVAPMPRKLNELFGPGRPRLEGFPSGVRPPVGTTPTPTKEVREKFDKYVRRITDPENLIEMVVGRPRLLYLSEAPFRIQVADEHTMTYSVIGKEPRELSLLGHSVGTTVFNLWFGDPDNIAKQTVLSYLINVLPDPEAKERLERVYKALEDEINRAFPDAYICLFLVGDKLAVSGEVKDIVEAAKILQIVRANAPQQQNNQQRGGPNNPGANIPVANVNLNLNPAPLFPGDQAPQTLDNFIVQGESNVINLLRVPGEQQVMLKVTVAEVSRAAARSIGINFSITNNNGIQVFAQTTGGISLPGANALNNAAGTVANLPALLDNGNVALAIQALRNVNLARSLAEPNLVTLNGRPAFFLAGGEFPVPVVTGATAVGLQGVSFVPFGVQLNFTPFITDKDRVRLQVNATVSTRDVATGANFGTGAATSTFVPGLNERAISTTVEMREGQTLAIGGLLQTNLAADTQRVPLFGDLPLGGQAFRFDRTQYSESELVLLVTPEIVHPLEPKEVPPLPGSDFFEPNDVEFYLTGRLESRRSYDFRSPVMNTLGRSAAYRHCELLYFIGPHGHSDGR